MFGHLAALPLSSARRHPHTYSGVRGTPIQWLVQAIGSERSEWEQKRTAGRGVGTPVVFRGVSETAGSPYHCELIALAAVAYPEALLNVQGR